MAYQEFITANALLKDTGLGMVDAARLILEASEVCGPSVIRIRESIWLGSQELRKREKSVPLVLAVEKCLEYKKDRRPRTLADIRQLMGRLLKNNPLLAECSLRSITTEQCEDALSHSFPTSRQRLKARVILSGVFSVGIKKGWCSFNPAEQVRTLTPKEQKIRPLTLLEIKTLLKASLIEEQGSCATATGLMIYAGIRPHEVERLAWEDICLHEKVISLRPQHTKTGGTRHVSILPVLENWLKECIKISNPSPDSSICPKNWKQKWRRVRQAAGWDKEDGKSWQQDCLRHTYASYHAKHFRNFPLLQIEMGHSSSDLLRTRYLNMDGVTQSVACAFWENNPVRL